MTEQLDAEVRRVPCMDARVEDRKGNDVEGILRGYASQFLAVDLSNRVHQEIALSVGPVSVVEGSTAKSREHDMTDAMPFARLELLLDL